MYKVKLPAEIVLQGMSCNNRYNVRHCIGYIAMTYIIVWAKHKYQSIEIYVHAPHPGLVEELDALKNELHGVYGSGDVDRFMTYFDVDCMFLPQGHDAKIGKEGNVSCGVSTFPLFCIIIVPTVVLACIASVDINAQRHII